jgi:hypothetical protein
MAKKSIQPTYLRWRDTKNGTLLKKSQADKLPASKKVQESMPVSGRGDTGRTKRKKGKKGKKSKR